MRIVVVGGGEGEEVRYCCSIINKAGIMLRWRSVELHKGNCWFTNRPKCEHTLEQSYSGMYSIFQQDWRLSFQKDWTSVIDVEYMGQTFLVPLDLRSIRGAVRGLPALGCRGRCIRSGSKTNESQNLLWMLSWPGSFAKLTDEHSAWCSCLDAATCYSLQRFWPHPTGLERETRWMIWTLTFCTQSSLSFDKRARASHCHSCTSSF